MIRVIYCWKVEPENQESFIQIWKETTNKIHEEVEGAKGSFMIQSLDKRNEIRTVARWDTLSQWESFWKSKKSYMLPMHDLGERTAIEVFTEIGDFTK